MNYLENARPESGICYCCPVHMNTTGPVSFPFTGPMFPMRLTRICAICESAKYQLTGIVWYDSPILVNGCTVLADHICYLPYISEVI
jgi:hypothetical protein